jgi:hypothetical protein
MATKLAAISMAGRIVIGLGRTQEDALRGIDVKHAGKTAINDDMKAMLDSVFTGEEEDDDGAIVLDSQPSIPGDNYVA